MLNDPFGGHKTKPNSIRWSPPRDGFVKLNFNGSMINQNAAFGFVIRNENGTIIIIRAHCVGQNTISVAECLALHGGLWMENSRGFKRIIVEGDSKLFIEFIYSVFNAPWRLKTILDDIRRLAGFFEDISWMHVFREANFLADAITSVHFSVNNFHV